MSYLAVSTFDDDNAYYDLGIRFSNLAMITNIRVHMLKHGTIADGTLTMDIYDDDGVVIASKALTYTELNTIPGTYAYGYVNFELDSQVCINKLESEVYSQLTARLTMTGHTEDTSNYMALVRQFDNPFITEYGSRPSSVDDATDGWFNPFGIEVYGVKR